MFDFITGFIMGRSIKKEPEVIEPPKPIIPPKPVRKVIKYIEIPELFNFDAALEESYEHYEEVKLITLHKNGNIYYYTEVLVPETDKFYGDSVLLDKI